MTSKADDIMKNISDLGGVTAKVTSVGKGVAQWVERQTRDSIHDPRSNPRQEHNTKFVSFSESKLLC